MMTTSFNVPMRLAVKAKISEEFRAPMNIVPDPWSREAPCRSNPIEGAEPPDLGKAVEVIAECAKDVTGALDV